MALPNFFKGKQIEWNDLSFFYEGARCSSIQGMRFGVKVDKQHIFGEGDETLGIQSGNREPSGSVKLLKTDVDALNKVAIAAGGRDLTDLKGNIVFTFKEAGVRKLQTMILSGAEFSEYFYGMEQNAKSMPVDLPFLYEDLIFGFAG